MKSTAGDKSASKNLEIYLGRLPKWSPLAAFNSIQSMSSYYKWQVDEKEEQIIDSRPSQYWL